jgi:hypothetical protein
MADRLGGVALSRAAKTFRSYVGAACGSRQVNGVHEHLRAHSTKCLEGRCAVDAAVPIAGALSPLVFRDGKRNSAMRAIRLHDQPRIKESALAINAASVPATAVDRGCALEQEPAAWNAPSSCSGRSALARSPPGRPSSTQCPMERSQARPHRRLSGGDTGGPLHSDQVMLNTSPSIRQHTSTWPASTDSAPYLPALVASS